MTEIQLTESFLKVRREACEYFIKKYTSKEPSLAMLDWAKHEWAYIDEIERLRSEEQHLLDEIASLKTAIQEPMTMREITRLTASD